MPITTMYQLRAVPVGAAVYYDEQKYIRTDEGWFGTEAEPQSRVIRDRYFNGPVLGGLVFPEGEQEIKVGATAVGDSFWYYVKAAPSDGVGPYTTIRIVNPTGERDGYGKTGTVENWDRTVTAQFLRPRLAPLPPEAEVYLRAALVGEIERLNTLVARQDERYNALAIQYNKEREEWKAASSLNTRLRDVLREIAA